MVVLMRIEFDFCRGGRGPVDVVGLLTTELTVHKEASPSVLLRAELGGVGDPVVRAAHLHKLAFMRLSALVGR